MAPMAGKKTTFAEQLRHLIQASGRSYGVIAAETGIDKATISRFMNHKGGLSMPNLNRLAAVLGWTVVSEGETGKRSG